VAAAPTGQPGPSSSLISKLVELAHPPGAKSAPTPPRLESAAAETKASPRDEGGLVSPGAPAARSSSTRRKTPTPAAPAKAANQSATKPTAQPDSESAAPSKTNALVNPAPRPPASAADLIREAQQAWLAGQNATAIAKARAGLKAQPTTAQTTQAYEIIGICSCGLRDGRTAREAASHLSTVRRGVVRADCEKNGVPID
jgi:hypothetical protein